MADLSDFKRGQIVGVCMAGTNVSKTLTTESFRAASSTVFKSNDSI